MSFTRPSLSDLIARAQADIDARLPGADSRVRRNVLDVLARTHAGAMHGAYGQLDALSRFLPDVAEAETLVRWGSLFGITRLAAEPATGIATLAGSNGTTVAAGAVLVRADGARFVTTADVTIAGGTAAAPVEAEAAGIAGIMATGQTLIFLSPIAGVNAIATVAAPGIAGGADEESDDQLRVRVIERMRSQPAGGKASDYVRWAKEVAGVTRAWVYPNWAGLGTVKLLFVMDGREDIIPPGGDVTAVTAKIAAERPVTADVTVAAPIADALAFGITLTPDTAPVRAAVTAELRDLIAREAEPGGTLLLSHIREAISIAAGEGDHVLAAPTANVTAAAGHIITMGAITW